MKGISEAWGSHKQGVQRALWLAAFVAVLSAAPVKAQFVESEFRASDGTAYQVLRLLPTLPNGAEKQRVTTLSGSSDGIGGCNSLGNAPGQVAAAVAGALPPLQLLHPLDHVRRSAVLVPNSSSITFDITNAGQVTLGTGAGAVHICRVPSDCPGGAADLVPLTSNSGGVPSACIASQVVTTCEGGNRRDVIAFGIPSSGDPPICTAPASVTTSTFICAAEPTDGFTMLPGQALVVTYNGTLAGMGFDIGAGGFGIDTNGSNPSGCAAGSVVNGVVRFDGHPGQPLPTSTPTRTNTPTSTATRTSTRTATFTNTATPSATPTRTPFCGNGIPEGPEQCDDGNNANGDCCSATCTFEATGSPCADDGRVCTNDQCNAVGVCVHPNKPEGTTCEDGDLCTMNSMCVAGQCSGGGPVTCDDHDECTNDQCVPSLGCLFEIGTESPECGSCQDGVDNNHDGLPDAEDPNCSTFHQLQRFAIIGTATDGLRSLTLGRQSSVVEADPLPEVLTATLRAGACGIDLKMGRGTLVTGAVALEGKARFSRRPPPIRILYQFVNDDASPAAVQSGNVTFVGPPGKCTDGTTPCIFNDDCPTLQTCETPLSIDDPANPNVIKTGMATEFIRCQNTLAAVVPTDQTIAALTATESLGEIRLRGGGSFAINLGHGQHIVDIDALRIAHDGRLTINGFPDTVVVFRVAGTFRIGLRSKVELTGGLSENNVLWQVGGAGRFVRIRSESTFPGTLLAAKRPKILIGALAKVYGALISKRIRMGRESKVIHRPFTALLEGIEEETPNLAIRAAVLRASSPQRDNGRVRLKVIVDDSNAQTFKAMLLANTIALNVHDASGDFNAGMALTGCQARSPRVVGCHSADGNTNATITTQRDDPNIHTITVYRRHLTVAQTGPGRPTAPITASLQQAAILRVGSISVCRERGTIKLSCRAP